MSLSDDLNALKLEGQEINASKVHDIPQHGAEAEAEPTVVRLCKQYCRYGVEADGNKALAFIEASQLTDDEARESLACLLEEKGRGNTPLTDDLASAVISRVPGTKAMVSILRSNPSKTLSGLLDCGSSSMLAMTSVLLDPTVWSDEQIRHEQEQVTLTFMTNEMKIATQKRSAMAMNVVTRLLAKDADHLHLLIQDDEAARIFDCLSITLPAEQRSQATLSTAKLLEAMGDRGQALIERYIISRMSAGGESELLQALSAGAAIFPIIPNIAAPLFLASDFVKSLTVVLEKTPSALVSRSALDLFSAAAINKACRETIVKESVPWLKRVSSDPSDRANATLAALVLMKIGADTDPTRALPTFKGVVCDTSNLSVSVEVEWLAYASMIPMIKQDLSVDRAFLLSLLKQSSENNAVNAILFGSLTIFYNLTTYRPLLSTEEKRMADLKAYANAAKQVPPDPLDDDKQVGFRCTRVLEASVATFIAHHWKSFSPTALALTASILLSLTQEVKHHGKMMQEGAIDTLLQLSAISGEESQTQGIRRNASWALSRLLTRCDPRLVFGGAKARHAASAIHPLSNLLKTEAQSRPSDLRPIFDVLRALTTIATLGEDSKSLIAKGCWRDIEEWCTSSASALQQAAVECVCNLADCQVAAVELLQDNQLRIFFALCSAERVETRTAAAGAMAQLLGFESAVERVVRLKTPIKMVLEQIEREDDDEMMLRLLSIVHGLTTPWPDTREARKASEAVLEEVKASVVLAGIRAGQSPQNQGLIDEILSNAALLKAG
ncbi:hypothetical protein MRB53_037178 [Persea americana]|nr:hypothetical protein MRB53_037178 [Persea americana]